MDQDPKIDYRALYESAPGLWIVVKADEAFSILGASDAYLAATLKSRDQILGRPFFEIFPDDPDDLRASGSSNLRASLEAVKRDKVPDAMAVQRYDIRRSDGEGPRFEERYWRSLSSPVFADDGSLKYITVLVEDVTELIHLGKKGEQQLIRSDTLQRESDVQHRAVLLKNQELDASANKVLKQKNDQLAENSERELSFERGERKKSETRHKDTLSRSLERGAAENQELRQENEQLVQDSERELAQERVERKKSDLRHRETLSRSEERGAALHQGVKQENEQLTEDSERQLSAERGERRIVEETLTRTEEQLRQVQKMEAVGRLAGGVAHDFNNILSVILGYGDILLDKMKDGNPLRDAVEQILKAGDRAANLTKQLLAFSRQQVVEPKDLDLNVLVTDMEKMLLRLIGEDIELKTVVTPGLDLVMADKGHLEQVVMNLVVNARDAMPNGGKLVIETANVELDQDYVRDNKTDVTTGAYVMLAVSDTGCGMDEVTRVKIFDPFFTTKELGQGTGLGLSTVYGIVKQGKGNIWVYSELGLGTTIKVYFPRSESSQKLLAVAPARPKAPSGTETILVAEDDPQVREMVRSILVEKGYKVIAANGGAEALKCAALVDRKIDLLLTDVIMPGMNGKELARQMLIARPLIRVLYMSGYTDNIIARNGKIEEGTVLLQKPFTSEKLLNKMREVLDAAPAGA